MVADASFTLFFQSTLDQVQHCKSHVKFWFVSVRCRGPSLSIAECHASARPKSSKKKKESASFESEAQFNPRRSIHLST